MHIATGGGPNAKHDVKTVVVYDSVRIVLLHSEVSLRKRRELNKIPPTRTGFVHRHTDHCAGRRRRRTSTDISQEATKR